MTHNRARIESSIRHLAVIPDGNRRWARERQSSLREAYAIGFCTVIDLALAAPDWGLTHLTFFGLSQDNLAKRPPRDVEVLFQQLSDSLLVASLLLRDNGIRIDFYGAIDALRRDHRDALAEIQATTAALREPRMRLNVLVNYSVAWDLRKGPRHFGTRAIPDCDVVFRSGGRRRLSGFLPVQSADAEICFSDILWPDVVCDEIRRIVENARDVPRTRGR